MLGLVMLPVYLRYLGQEAYGLVGFFTLLQAWFQLLDLGLTPTVSRELSRYRAGVLAPEQAAAMVRTLEWLFAVLGLCCALAVVLGAPWVVHNWLKVRQLDQTEVQRCVVLMGGMVAPRWLVGLYRGGLAGLERMVTINVANLLLALLRAGGAWLVLALWAPDPGAFFVFQASIGLLELLLMGFLFYQAGPMRAGWRPDWRAMRGCLRLAGSMAFLAGLWVVLSQTDKLVLSGLLDLPSYGAYTVAVTLAGGILQLAAPLTQVLQPRFSVLVAQDDKPALVALYRAGTQVAGAGLFALAGTLALFSGPLLRAWTGNPETVALAVRVLPLYALGNAVVALLSLAFAVQFAYGRTRWHVVGNCVFGVFWVPGVYWCARQAGAVGAGWLWLLGNMTYLLLWLPYIHRRLLPPGCWRLLLRDVVVMAASVAVILLAFAWLGLPQTGRMVTLACLGGVAVVTAVGAMLMQPEGRALLLTQGRRFRLVLFPG